MLEAFIARFGYAAIVAGTFLEGEAVLVAAGAFAHRGLLSLPWVMLAAFVGSVVGDQLWFQLGRRFGPGLLARRPTWQAQVDRVQALLARYGTVFVFGFRFVVGLRTITPALLGISGYPVSRFVPLNIVGGPVWAVGIGAAGYALGASLSAVLARAAHVEELLLAVAAVAVLVFVAWRLRQRRSRANSITR